VAASKAVPLKAALSFFQTMVPVYWAAVMAVVSGVFPVKGGVTWSERSSRVIMALLLPPSEGCSQAVQRVNMPKMARKMAIMPLVTPVLW
jgi:hypothetical protein